MELAASNLTRESRELEEIEAALDRLYWTPDSFGVCETTGWAIPFERLDVTRGHEPATKRASKDVATSITWTPTVKKAAG